MTLLEEFIFSLNKTERGKLRPLQFRGPKRKIFFKVLECRTRGGIESELILKSNKLSAKRYYQLLNQILEACYRDIVPEGGTNLLLFLGNKHLFRHFYNEMKKQEAFYRSGKNIRAMEQFYFNVLVERTLFVLHPKFNEKLSLELERYAARYIEIKKPHLHDSLYLRTVEISKLLTRPFADPSRGFNKEQLDAMLRELEGIFEQIKEGDFILATFTINTRLMWLLSQFPFEGKTAAKYAAFGIELMKKHPVLFASVSDFYTFECLQILQTDEANNIGEFKKYLVSSSERLGTSLVHIAHYFSRIVNHGDLEWGRKYIEKFFPYNIELLRDDAAIYYYYMLIIYNVWAGNDAESEQYLGKAFSRLKGKNRDITANIILRCYDAFFTAMHGDPVALENAVSRHLRFGRLHGLKNDKTAPMFFLGSINDLIKYIGMDRIQAEIILRNFQEQFMLNRGLVQFPYLFGKIYGKYFQPGNEKAASISGFFY